LPYFYHALTAGASFDVGFGCFAFGARSDSKDDAFGVGCDEFDGCFEADA
jgi:hypothetical protein